MDVGHTQHGHTDPLPSITIPNKEITPTNRTSNEASMPSESSGLLLSMRSESLGRGSPTLGTRCPAAARVSAVAKCRAKVLGAAHRTRRDSLYNCISAFFHQTYIWKIADNHAISRSTHTTSMYDVHLHYWTVVPGAPRSELMPDNMSDNMTDGWIAEGHSAPQTELSAASRRSSSHS